MFTHKKASQTFARLLLYIIGNVNYFTFTNSTSNSKVALAGITGG
jgi:hypothetical protein